MKANSKISAIVSCYKGSKYLQEFLENTAAQTIRDRLEIVLVHNEPDDHELSLVKDFQTRFPGLVRHIVVPREKLAISTNRAIHEAVGDYVCVWNIDDLRTDDSLERMAKVLDENDRIGFTYGDYVIVNSWLKKEGVLIIEPEFEKMEFIRSMHLGPFYMWRKSLCEKLGVWDEQCLQGADYEYAVRLAVEYEGKKTPGGSLGYYLDEGLGLSTKRATLQPIERTFIELRYGVYRKIDFWYLMRALKYDIENVSVGTRLVSVDTFASHRKMYMDGFGWWMYAIVRYPFWILERIVKKLKRKFYDRIF